MVDGGGELLSKNINRTYSENRTKRFILCTDVIEGMQKLDQCGRPMPTFLCDANGVGRLPTFSPEDYNVVSLDEQCQKLERPMRSVQQETTLRVEAWAKLEDQVDHMELVMGQYVRYIHAFQDLNVIRHPTSTPSVLPTQLTETSHEDSVSANNIHKSVVVPNKTAQYCDVTKSHQESETQLSSSASNDDVTAGEVSGEVSGTEYVQNVSPIVKDSTGDIVTPANPTELTQNKDHMLKDGFQYSKGYRDKLAKNNTQKSIQDTATDRGSYFVAAEHISVHKVFITNVNNSVDLNKVKSWLSKKNISFLKINRKSKPDYINQSYVLTVIEGTYKKKIDATLWPPGVNVRDYNPPPKKE